MQKHEAQKALCDQFAKQIVIATLQKSHDHATLANFLVGLASSNTTYVVGYIETFQSSIAKTSASLLKVLNTLETKVNAAANDSDRNLSSASINWHKDVLHEQAAMQMLMFCHKFLFAGRGFEIGDEYSFFPPTTELFPAAYRSIFAEAGSQVQAIGLSQPKLILHTEQ